MTTLLNRLWKLSLTLFLIFSISTFNHFLSPQPVLALGEEMAPDAEMSLQKWVGANDGFIDALAEGLDCRVAGCPDAQIIGAIPLETRYLSLMMINRPASTSRYLAHLMDNIGIPTPPTVHAQGTGYRMFEPIINLWQIFRNLAYTIYILIFLVIGFMIMFRTKINAQTVITIQSALPNLIITLLLITFSYAIAGFLVDIMYFLIYFLIYLAGSNHLLDAKMTLDYFLKHSLVGIFSPFGDNGVINQISVAIMNIFYSLIGSLHHTEGNVGSWLIKLFISVVIFLQLGRLFLSLLKSYLMVIIQIITAPLQILPNAIPGSKAFMTWLKTLASYLAPFPIITAVFLLAIIFAVPGTETNLFGINQPIFSADSKLRTFPYIAGRATTSQDIAGLISFALILISPAAVKMAQDFFKVKESPYTSEVMSGIGMGFKTIGTPISMISNWKRQHRENLSQNRMTNAIETMGQTLRERG